MLVAQVQNTLLLLAIPKFFSAWQDEMQSICSCWQLWLWGSGVAVVMV
jgi:hypothetical protein